MWAEVTDFDQDGPLQGFYHANGVLQVLQSGTYHIYLKAFFEGYPMGHRLAFVVNGV